MRTTPQLALAALVLAVAPTACLFVTEFSEPTGGAGGGSGSVATTTNASSSSDSASSSSGMCTDTLSDPENCGGCGRSCGGSACTAGICAPVRTALVAGTGVRAIDMQPGSEPLLFTSRRADSFKAAIERRSPIFAPGDAPLKTSLVDEGLSGRLFGSASATFPTSALYAPQQDDCNGAPCVHHCAGSSDCTTTRLANPSSPVSHVNGVAVTGSLAFHVVAADRRVYATPMSCIAGGNAQCASKIVVNELLGSTGTASAASTTNLIDLDPQRKALWWSTFDESGSETCVYTLPLPTMIPTSDCTDVSCAAPCVVSSAAIPNLWGLVASSAGVFVGTSSPPELNPVGPVFRVDPETKSVTPIPVPDVRFPADSDDTRLYAYERTASSRRVVVIDATSLALVAAASMDASEELVAVDASATEWVYFVTNENLYRWRKPPVAP